MGPMDQNQAWCYVLLSLDDVTWGKDAVYNCRLVIIILVLLLLLLYYERLKSTESPRGPQVFPLVIFYAFLGAH